MKLLVCGRNEFEVEQLLQNAKNRLIELEPNLFDFMNYNNQKLTNKDMRVIGDELIFGKLLKILVVRIYYSKRRR